MIRPGRRKPWAEIPRKKRFKTDDYVDPCKEARHRPHPMLHCRNGCIPGYNGPFVHSLRYNRSMLRRFWLLFAQITTVCVAALFVVATLRPDLLARVAGKNDVVLVQEMAPTLAAPKIESLADAAKKAMPSVVNIYTSKEVRQRNPLLDDPLLRRFFPGLSAGEPRRATSLGSGVIVSSEGYVLTNNHVIEGADDIQLVLADGRRLRATVRGSDPESDLAVLKADGKDLPAITFGQLDNVQVGDAVLALGKPIGFGNSVTHGSVSALGRNHLGINVFEDFIQTDAAVNPGN
jgi:serine protease DegQ